MRQFLVLDFSRHRLELERIQDHESKLKSDEFQSNQRRFNLQVARRFPEFFHFSSFVIRAFFSFSAKAKLD